MPLQLKDTAERILAVDRAAAMVEEMLRQGHILQPAPSTFHLAMNIGVKVGMHCDASFCLCWLNWALTLHLNSLLLGYQALSACVFLGFEPDPSLNIAARIHGPNVCFFFFLSFSPLFAFVFFLIG